MTDSVEQLTPLQYPLVNKFYKQTGYGGSAGREEFVFVVRRQTSLVAAVRLQPQDDGWLFLRAMCVEPNLRQQGVGATLLMGITTFLNQHTVYCFPFDHLQDFYTRGGFERVEVTALPEYGQQAFLRYQAQGRRILAMVRHPV